MHRTIEHTFNQAFCRSEAVLGPALMEKMAQHHVILFGVGGVGSWCAEALVRTGFRHLTLVDDDVVAPSNINRQLMATTSTIGLPKVEVLRQRLLDINPEADIQALCQRYEPGCDLLQRVVASSKFQVSSFNSIIIDCIDSLDCKAALILEATSLPTTVRFYSSMGAAQKSDITKIHAAEFWKVQGCPLARALRSRFKKSGTFPARKFTAVYSEEIPHPLTLTPNPSPLNLHPSPPLGSLMHITATFGLYLVDAILKDLSQSVT